MSGTVVIDGNNLAMSDSIHGMTWTDVPCKLWTDDPAKINRYGSGRRINGHRRQLHVATWIEAYGEPPPETPHVLHHCDTPACYELEHLWLGTHAENMADMKAKGRAGRNGNQFKTHCKRGHEFTEENTYTRPDGGRGCRLCHLDASRRYDGWQGGLPPAEKTHCPHGHPYDEANTYNTPDGKRVCRACRRVRVREWKRADRARRRSE